MTMAAHSDRPASLASDDVVVLQLLEEIHHLILPSANGVLPSALRLQAAAKLYLDTRDAFETIERNVEGRDHGRPKLLRKLSKRHSVIASPRDSEVLPTATPREDTTPAGALYTARGDVEETHANGSLSARPPPHSPRHARISETSADDSTAPELSDVILDRIQDLFRHLGDMLSRAILDELRHRNVPIQTALHYVRFLPADAQWTAYMEKRDEEVRGAYNPQRLSSETLLQQLKRNAEFIKEQIRKDVNMLCLFSADGTLSTIFGDDITTDAAVVAEKFEGLIRDVYATYLYSIIELKMDQLLRVSDQWQQDMAVSGASAVSADAPLAHLYVRARKFRAKIPIFPHAITAIDDRASSAMLPHVPAGQQVRVLVADLNDLGVWWQKTILAATDRDVTTVHTDDTRGLAGVNASLDGQLYVPLLCDSASEFLRRYGRNGGLAKWQGHRLLVNNGKDSLWVEVTVLEVEDNKRCKLQLKKSIEKATETLAWQQLLAQNEWLQIKDLKLCVAPLNPSFRIHMGLKFHSMVDVFQSLVTEISSIFPNEDLEHRVGKSLWQAVEPSLSRGEHIYARYFRSVLNQELPPRQRTGLSRHHSSFERASSIVLASASMRHLVAALEHSALANGTGSLSGPSMGRAPSSAATTPYSPSPQRRLSLGASISASFNHQHHIGRSVENGYFDDKGVYHYQLVLPDMPFRAHTTEGPSISPFDKLAHHLLEEKEMIGACIQNNNIALGRAFAQVLQEKLTRLAKQIQSKLDQHDETAGALETVLTEYASACRFLYTWHIVRHEMDTVARQRRTTRDRSASTIHAEWVDRSFHRMDALVGTMLHLQLQFLQRVFFHECARYTLSGICEQHWTSSKPWFSNSRCTYAIQFTVFRVQTLFENVVLRLLAQYERTLCVHEKMHDMSAWLLVDLVGCVSSLYETLVVSRVRVVQWRMDILYLVVGIHRLLRLLEKMLTSKTVHAHHSNGRSCKKPTLEIREICLRLLACLAVRVGPANAVADELLARLACRSVVPSHVDAITEFEVHVTAIRSAISMHRSAPSVLVLEEDETSSWTSHCVFGDVEIKHLATVELNWPSLIARSSLSTETLLASLRHRHELGDWQYPPLTDEQVKARTRLQECVHQLEAHLHRDACSLETPPIDDESSGDRSTLPSRAGAPEASRQRSSPSLQGPAATGSAEDQAPLLPNNPSREQSEPSLVVTKPSSTSPSKHMQSDVTAVPPTDPTTGCSNSGSGTPPT